MAEPFDHLTLHAVRLGLLDRSVLSDAQRAQLARPVAAPPLLIDLVEPDAPEPWGDRLPCHLLMREVEWHAPLPANLSVLASAFGALGYSPALDYVDYPGNSAFLKAPAPAVPVCPPPAPAPASGRILPVLVVAASLAAALGGLFVYLYPFIHALTATP